MSVAYSLQEAADKVGVSKSTIHRATKRKKNPLSKNEDGRIEPSELSRLYPEAFSGGTGGTSHETFHGTMRNGGVERENSSENAVLHVKLEAAEKLAAERERALHHRDATITDLRSRLDQSEQKRDEAQTQLTALLTDQREKASQEAIQRPLVRQGYVWALLVALAAVAAVLGYLWLNGAGGAL